MPPSHPSGRSCHGRTPPEQVENQEYLIVGVEAHDASRPIAAAAAGRLKPTPVSYDILPRAALSQLPKDPTPGALRASRLAKRWSPGTAKEKEEISTDEHVTAHLGPVHWAPRNRKNPARSASRRRGGKEMGAIFLPRNRTGGVVDFIEGDPDRPLSRVVYNGDNKPHTISKKQKHFRLEIRLRKTHGGYKEFVFDDHQDLKNTDARERDPRSPVKHAATGRSARRSHRRWAVRQPTTITHGDDQTDHRVGNQTRTLRCNLDRGGRKH